MHLAASTAFNSLEWPFFPCASLSMKTYLLIGHLLSQMLNTVLLTSQFG